MHVVEVCRTSVPSKGRVAARQTCLMHMCCSNTLPHRHNSAHTDNDCAEAYLQMVAGRCTHPCVSYHTHRALAELAAIRSLLLSVVVVLKSHKVHGQPMCQGRDLVLIDKD